MSRSPLYLAAAGAALLGYALWPRREEAEYGPEYRPEELNPTKWVTGYKRGLPFPLQVMSVGNGAWLDVSAAEMFLAMQRAAATEGIILLPGSGWRSMTEQTVLWLKRQAGLMSAAVARPGTSNHQAGVAVDIAIDRRSITYDSPEFTWLIANAGKYGYSWDEGGKVDEPWHWRFVG